ncbi:hypothetical protein [Nautilia sp.]
MKKAKQIIGHLLNPYSDDIEKQRCLKKIISLLPPKYNKYITSCQLKGEILFFNVSHQAVKQELYYNKNLIFSIIKTMHSVNMCLKIKPKKIITNYRYNPKPKTPGIYKFYIKPAGNFEIKAKKKKVREKFEEIKNLLKSN